MTIYYVLYIVASLIALNSKRINNLQQSRKITIGWLIITLILIFVMGFRFEVGGDWNNYQKHYINYKNIDLKNIFIISDPGYFVVNKISDYLGLGITGVNLIVAILFVPSLIKFCKSQTLPWLSLAISIPYLYIVVGMGYTRQAIALGFVMISMLAIQKNEYKKFIVFVLVGALFHKSAVIIIPIVALASSKNKVQTIFSSILFTIIGYYLFIESEASKLIETYTDPSMQSSGALIRSFMNFIPGIIYLIYSKKMKNIYQNDKIWYIISIFTTVIMILVIITPYSTALDRVSLYFIPLQLVVLTRYPLLSSKNKEIIKIIIVLYYLSVLFVWLSFADNSWGWIPYKLGITLE